MKLISWAESEESEGQIASFDHGSTYLWTHEIERFLDEKESNSMRSVMKRSRHPLNKRSPGSIKWFPSFHFVGAVPEVPLHACS